MSTLSQNLKAENEAIVGEGNFVTANAPTSASPQLKLAVKLSEMSNANNQHLVGVLLTQAEAFITNDRQLKAYKQLIQRELYNHARQRVELIHSIVGRAEVNAFREYPTLEEQALQPAPESFEFDVN
jgi:hypothetical protein